MGWKICVGGFPLGQRLRPRTNLALMGYPESWPTHIYVEYHSGLSVEIGSCMLRILASGCQYEFCTGVRYAAMYVVTPASFHWCARRLSKCATSANLLRTPQSIDATIHMYPDRRQNNTIKMQIAHNGYFDRYLIFFREHLRFTTHNKSKGQKVKQNIYLRPSCRNLCRFPSKKEQHNVESTDERREAGGP